VVVPELKEVNFVITARRRWWCQSLRKPTTCATVMRRSCQCRSSRRPSARSEEAEPVRRQRQSDDEEHEKLGATIVGGGGGRVGQLAGKWKDLEKNLHEQRNIYNTKKYQLRF
jgi:hypothetical protein